ncbi:MAG: protein translocase SEC61 complex subunit gamma [Candidatus Aenigmatarchaeota archaeon]
MINLKETLSSYKRVLMVTKKPEKDEYFLTGRICAMGIVIIGVMGFAFYFMSVLLGM